MSNIDKPLITVNECFNSIRRLIVARVTTGSNMGKNTSHITINRSSNEMQPLFIELILTRTIYNFMPIMGNVFLQMKYNNNSNSSFKTSEIQSNGFGAVATNGTASKAC